MFVRRSLNAHRQKSSTATSVPARRSLPVSGTASLGVIHSPSDMPLRLHTCPSHRSQLKRASRSRLAYDRPVAKAPTFSLQFQPGEIDELRGRYDYPTDHQATAAGRHARERGYYTKTEFILSVGGSRHAAPDEPRRTRPPRSAGRPGSPSVRTMKQAACER